MFLSTELFSKGSESNERSFAEDDYLGELAGEANKRMLAGRRM
jgi:hypothetical protein